MSADCMYCISESRDQRIYMLYSLATMIYLRKSKCGRSLKYRFIINLRFSAISIIFSFLGALSLSHCSSFVFTMLLQRYCSKIPFLSNFQKYSFIVYYEILFRSMLYVSLKHYKNIYVPYFYILIVKNSHDFIG